MSMTTTNVLDIRGVAYEPIITEILFKNKTVAENYVTFATDIKANTIFSENVNTVSMQAYTYGEPSTGGTITLSDVIVTPVKVMFYDEFNYEALRTSRFNRTMAAGAWETASSEFERTVLQNISNYISANAETKFWNGATSATQTAVAALTTGTTNATVSPAQKTYVAGADTNLFDGVVTRLIYNNTAVGKRIRVDAVSAITSATIGQEYALLYAAIPAEVLESGVELPFIYAPRSHKQLINIFNSNQTYRDLFSVEGGRYFYQGIEIKFVPVPEKVMICALPSSIVWCTDLLDDMAYLKVMPIAANRDDYFYKSVFTMFAHVVNQKYITLYVG